MTTNIRPSISDNNKYWISKHRYYELKHFCLQYPTWKKAYSAIDGFKDSPSNMKFGSVNNSPSDTTAKFAAAKIFYSDKFEMIEKAAFEADEELGSYILRAVTEELSYTYLKSRLDMPCCKSTYYDRYRRFFWLLSKARN